MGTKRGEILVTTEVPGRELTALLYNFDVGSAVVKQEHRDWIKTHVPPFLMHGWFEGVVSGFASRTGPDALNWKLSEARANNIEKVISDLEQSISKSQRKLAHTKFHFGELAAAIAGEKDGNENDKWRGVILSFASPKIVPPKPDARKPVKRRVHVELILDDKPSGQIPTDGKGDGAFALSKAILNHVTDWEKITKEDTADIYDNWTLAKIVIQKRVTDGMYIVESLHVDYIWYPPPPYPRPPEFANLLLGTTLLVEQAQDNLQAYSIKLSGKVLDNESTVITASEAEKWLQSPRKTYLSSH